MTNIEKLFTKHHNVCRVCKGKTYGEMVELDKDDNFCDRTNNPPVKSVKMRVCSCGHKFTPAEPSEENMNKFKNFMGAGNGIIFLTD